MSVKSDPGDRLTGASHQHFNRLKLHPEILDIDVPPVLLSRDLRSSTYLRWTLAPHLLSTCSELPLNCSILLYLLSTSLFQERLHHLAHHHEYSPCLLLLLLPPPLPLLAPVLPSLHILLPPYLPLTAPVAPLHLLWPPPGGPHHRPCPQEEEVREPGGQHGGKT